MSQDRPTVLPRGESILSTKREDGGTTRNAFRRAVSLRACASGRDIAATSTRRLATPDRTRTVLAVFVGEGAACTPFRADRCLYSGLHRTPSCEFPRRLAALPEARLLFRVPHPARQRWGELLRARSPSCGLPWSSPRSSITMCSTDFCFPPLRSTSTHVSVATGFSPELALRP